MAFAFSFLLAFSLGLLIYVFFVQPLWVLAALEWPNVLYRAKTEKALVALSFDDGPHAEFTPQLLEILERFGAKATFFLIGERAERHPELVRRILDEGHEIGNHYWKDGSVLGHLSEKFVKRLEATERVIQAAPPDRIEDDSDRRREGYSEKAASSRRTPKFFRAPGGVAWPWQLRLVRERGYTCVLGCAYPHDPMRPPVEYICWLIKKNLRPGTIVILHDGIQDATRGIAVLPEILAEGARRGLKFVSIGELVERGG